MPLGLSTILVLLISAIVVLVTPSPEPKTIDTFGGSALNESLPSFVHNEASASKLIVPASRLGRSVNHVTSVLAESTGTDTSYATFEPATGFTVASVPKNEKRYAGATPSSAATAAAAVAVVDVADVVADVVEVDELSPTP